MITPEKRQALEELTQKLAKESGCILDEEEDEDQDEGADQDGDLDLGSAERDDQIVPEVAAQEACIIGFEKKKRKQLLSSKMKMLMK